VTVTNIPLESIPWNSDDILSHRDERSTGVSEAQSALSDGIAGTTSPAMPSSQYRHHERKADRIVAFRQKGCTLSEL
jgi:hypothetical protein